jgi:hypothetical protein
MGQLVLKRAAASRFSGEWSDDDYDVLCEGEVVGRIMKRGVVVQPPAPTDGTRTWNIEWAEPESKGNKPHEPHETYEKPHEPHETYEDKEMANENNDF